MLELFVKKIDPTSSEPIDNPDAYASMVMNPMDNLDNIDDEYIKMLEKMPEKERMRFLNGEFTDDDDGAAYYAFDREKHVQDLPKPNGTTWIGMDFNVMPMTACVGYYVNNIFYIYDEIWLEHSDTYKMTDELLKRNYKGTIIPDSTGRNRKTSGKSDHQILKEAGFQIPYVQNPFVFDRVNNINRLFTNNRIIINPRCKKLIGDLEKVSWKNNKLFAGQDGMLGHITDALGYLCWKLSPIEEEINTRGIILE